MKKFLSLLLCAVLLAGCLPISALAAGPSGRTGPVTYYVSVEGRGGSAGTSESAPLPSLRAVPWDTLGPGDQVLLKKGDVFSGYIQLEDVHGTQDAPIVIGSYGTGSKPVIHAQGGGIWFQNYGGALADAGQKWQGYVSSAVLLYDCDYVTVQDLEVTNEVLDEARWFQSGEESEQGYGIMDRTGVAVVAKDAGVSEGITLTDVSVRNVTGNGQDAKMANGGIVFAALAPEAASAAASFDHASLSGCTVADVTQTGIGFYSYQNAPANTNVTLTNCTVSGATGDGIVAEGATITGSQVVSSDHSLKAARFELSGTTLNVPTGTTAASLLAGVTAHEAATVTVTKDGAVQGNDTAVTADMKLVITAQDGSGSSQFSLALKDGYTHSADWPGHQQGNVWFAQSKVEGAYADLTSWDTTWSCWSGDGFAAVERNKITPNINIKSEAAATCAAFRAPVAGRVTLSFHGDVKVANGNVAGNTGTIKLSITKNGAVQGAAHTLNMDGSAAAIDPVAVDVAQGDFLRVELTSMGDNTNAGVLVDPVVTYSSVSNPSSAQAAEDAAAEMMAETATPRLRGTQRPDTAATFYVSTLHGSDSYDGLSQEHPFYSLSKINAMELKPGDKIYLERGSVWNGEALHIRDQQGTAAAPIVIGAYGEGDKPAIHAKSEGIWYQNYRRGFAGTGHQWTGYVSSSILLYDTEYIEVSGLAVTNWGKGGEAATEDDYSGVVPGELDGLNPTPAAGGVSSNKKPYYNYGLKLDRTGVAVITQNIGTSEHIHLQDLDVENVYGNVYDKHMANGGIYAIALYPLDDATGVARYDDLLIQGCYVKRVSRWGIGAGCAAYDGLNFGQTSANNAITDETARTYGSTNIVVRGNYLENVGGDPITVFNSFAPLVEYNTAYRCTSEINTTVYTEWTMGKRTHMGRVAAGIWPWKCKNALFRHNECYVMLWADGHGNGDGQPWDADSGDSTVYEYNYSSGNTGGVIMFCAGNSYNSVFRYNISFLDGTPGSGGPGVIDMTGNPNGKLYNNTFILPTNVRAHYRTSGPGITENNIFATKGASYDPNWGQNPHVTFRNNLYVGFSTTPSGDTATAALADVFAATPVGPTAPLSRAKGASRTVDGVCIGWCHDLSAFDSFKLKAGGPAVNAGKVIALSDGLASDHGVQESETDYFGVELDGTPDLGACDTAAFQASSDCALKTCLFEVSGTTLNVPTGTTAASLLAGITVHEAATAAVKSGNAVQAGTAAVTAGMTLVVTAEDGTENVYTLALKDGYTHSADWPGHQQGNVWFAQSKVAGVYADLTNWDSEWNCWSGDGYAAVEPSKITPNINIKSEAAATCAAFRAPVAGRVTLSFNGDVKVASANVAGNTGTITLSITKNGEVQGAAHTLNLDGSAASISPVTVDVAQGDFLRVELTSMGDNTNAGVLVDPVVTYGVSEGPDEPPQPSADTTALETAIAAANAAKAGVAVSDKDASQVSKGLQFVTTAEMEALNAAIAAGQEALTKDQATVDAAADALNAAVVTFTAAIKTGAKEAPPSGGGTGSSGGPGKPTGGSTVPSKPTTPNKPVTTTDPTTGAVTVTSQHPNGGTVVTVTTPEVGKTITVTNAQGAVKAQVFIPARVPVPADVFLDIPYGHWASEAVDTVAGLGLFQGTAPQTFSGEGFMTRGTMVTVLHRLSGGVKSVPQPFRDVNNSAYYADAVNWAAANGIAHGVSSSAFAPDSTITREQLVTMVYRYAAFLGLDTAVEGDALAAYGDARLVSSWARDAVNWAVQVGLISGRGPNLAPAGYTTRAEAAVIFTRLIELVK